MDFHREKRASATLLVHRKAGSNSLVRMDRMNHIVHFLERPAEAERSHMSNMWVNSVLQVLNRRMLSYISIQPPSDLPRVVQLSGYRCAIDSPERYTEAQEAVATGRSWYAGVTRPS